MYTSLVFLSFPFVNDQQEETNHKWNVWSDMTKKMLRFSVHAVKRSDYLFITDVAYVGDDSNTNNTLNWYKVQISTKMIIW